MSTDGPANICLVGLMGSGKSTVAPLLAGRLGREHIDLDKEIALRLGRTIMMIFADPGEESFRREEQVVLQHYCSRDGLVIDCGGGIILAAGNRPCLKDNFTVYLETSPETLALRVGSASGRPLLQGAEPLGEQLAALLEEREPLYRECAAEIITTDSRSPTEIADQIIAHLPANLKPAAS